MKKVCICGHFGFGKNLFGGQEIKTASVYKELCRCYGAEQVSCFDTHGGIYALGKLLFCCIRIVRKHQNIIIMPASNGLKIMAPLFLLLNKLAKRKLHYIVIGGWLPLFLERRRILASLLMCFDAIYVETQTMRKAMERLGFTNVIVMPNFKDLNLLTEAELKVRTTIPYPLCTFSRVRKEKGIDIAVEAVKMVNHKYNQTVFTLDIYGQIDPGQEEWFASLKDDFPVYIHYKGVVPFEKSVETLKNYSALLFPTCFFTEGIPGTIIDAYAAGIPVIASRWESYSDIIDEETGMGYAFDDQEGLKNILCSLAEDASCLYEKKAACLRRAHDFLPETAIEVLLTRLNTSK